MGLFSKLDQRLEDAATCACGHGGAIPAGQPGCDCARSDCACNPREYRKAYGHDKPTR